MRGLIALPTNRKFLVIEAVLTLLFARLVVLIPIARWSHYLGDLQTETPLIDDSSTVDQVKRIGWSMYVVSPRLPWRADCLPQAIAARLMLQHRKIPSTLYLGVAKTQENGQAKLEAHAWLRSGTITVTGGEVRHRFNVVSTFAKVYR